MELLRRNLVSELFYVAGDIHNIVSQAGRLIDESCNHMAVPVPPFALEEVIKHESVPARFRYDSDRPLCETGHRRL